MLPVIKQVAGELKKGLLDLFGDDLESLILYGSHARGDYHEESDVDFALVLKTPIVSDYAVIKKTARIETTLSIKYNLTLSTLSTSTHILKTSMKGIYQNIRREGIVI